MQFKDSKQGYPIYLLNRKEVSVSVGKLTNTPISHFDNNFRGATSMVVDLNVELDGKVTSYVLNDSAEVGYVSDMMITINRECIVRELQSIKNQSEDALKMVEYHTEAVSKCNQLLKEYSEEYKERSEYSARLDKMDDKIEKLTNAISMFISNQGTA